MKTILRETLSVLKVSLFWALALPTAAIVFSAANAWDLMAVVAQKLTE